jgi:redox-sensitive bicupin YhaK (pirin superfamily)
VDAPARRRAQWRIVPAEPHVIEAVVTPSTRDLGDGFQVHRALPSMQRRMIGPFVFLDEMGPVRLAPGTGLDVRPHPHIGLATVTYLFEGEILHQDSLGVRQPIRPGDVNWMIAGRGIVHSERTPQPLRAQGPGLWGLQSWLALPQHDEELAPSFRHHPAEELPRASVGGAEVRLIAGTLLGLRSPVKTLSALFYADATLDEGAELELAPEHEERGAYVVDGGVSVDGQEFQRGRLLVFRPAVHVVLKALTPARVMLLGGQTLGPRHVWWNFVSSSRERIELAKQDWKAGRFGAVPGDPDFIPLPEERRADRDQEARPEPPPAS